MSSAEINENGQANGLNANISSKTDSVTISHGTNGSTIQNFDELYRKLTLAESKLMLLLNKTGADVARPLKNKIDIDCVQKIEHDLSEIDHGKNLELVFLYKVVMAHCLLLGGKAERAKLMLEFSSLHLESSHYEYTKVANIQASVIMGSALSELGEKQRSLEIYEKAVKQKYARPKSTALSNDESRWLHVLYHKLNGALADEERSESSLIQILKEYVALFEQDPTQFSSPSKTKMIKLLIRLTKGNHSVEGRKGIQNLLNSSGREFLSRLSTPKSTDTNDVVENYIDILMAYWETSTNSYGHLELVVDSEDHEYTKQLLSTVTAAIYSTFHSCILARHLITILVSLGEFKEAKAAFKTYKSYIHHVEVELEKHATARGNVGDSWQGRLDLKSKMVYVFLRTESENSMELKALGESLTNLLKRSMESESRPDSVTMSRAHLAAALAYMQCSKNSKNEKDYLGFMAKASEHYEQAMKDNVPDSDTYFHYSLALSFSNNSIDAIKIAKEGLIHDTDHLGLWHLLSLLISVQEDYKVSLDVLSGAVKAYTRSHDEDVTKYQFETKKILLQMAMTRVALIEALNGTEEALEAVPEVFNWFGDLFPDTYTSDDVNGKKPSSDEANTHHVAGSLSFQVSLLQEIWLWAASCYRRADQFKEAEEAVGEAERIGGVNASTHAALGFLMSETRPIHAMEEFQRALEDDLDNLEATVGMAKLVLEHSRIGNAGPKVSKENPYALFTSEKDELAAHARVSALLQQQVKGFRGRRSSEAWWLLGEFYSKFNDSVQAQNAMWRCLALENNRAVRDYAYADVDF